MKGFLNYWPGDSFFHKLNPLTKIFMAFLICICCFISDRLSFLVAVIALNLIIAAAMGVFSRAVMLIKGLFKISLFIFILQLLLVRQGNALVTVFDFSITDYGLFVAVSVALRLMAATLPLALMLSVTKMNDLSNVLVTSLKIPYKYAFTLTTALRFIPVFADEMSGIIDAQASRGVELDAGGFFKKMGLILPLCAPLLITSVKKIESSAISAELRGFYLRNKESSYKKYSFGKNDIAIALLSVVLVFLSAALNDMLLF